MSPTWPTATTTRKRTRVVRWACVTVADSAAGDESPNDWDGSGRRMYLSERSFEGWRRVGVSS